MVEKNQNEELEEEVGDDPELSSEEEPIEKEAPPLKPQTRFQNDQKEDRDETKIINELGYKIRKAKKALEEAGFDPKEVLGESEEDFTSSPEDRPVTVKDLNSVLQKLEEKNSSESMLNQFLDQYPSYRKYAGQIREHMHNSAYSQVPI